MSNEVLEKKVWVIQQKQPSKGYFNSVKPWRGGDKPIFTKDITRAARFTTMKEGQAGLIKAVNELTKVIDDYKEKTSLNRNAYYASQIPELEKQREFCRTSLYVREVTLGIRWNKAAKHKIEFEENDNNRYCCSCGADVPDAEYLMVGYFSLCICCLSEIIPDIQKKVETLDPALKELWSKERFLKDLG